MSVMAVMDSAWIISPRANTRQSVFHHQAPTTRHRLGAASCCHSSFPLQLTIEASSASAQRYQTAPRACGNNTKAKIEVCRHGWHQELAGAGRRNTDGQRIANTWSTILQTAVDRRSQSAEQTGKKLGWRRANIWNRLVAP